MIVNRIIFVLQFPAAKDANGIVSVIMAETARTVIICFFMVKPPVM